MNPRFLVLGATGRVGALVLRALAGQCGVSPDGCPSVGGLVRDARRAGATWPAGTAMVVGDLTVPASIDAAMHDVEAVWMASPVHPDMATWQCHVVRAAAQAGVRRIVKLSGSAWTMIEGRHTTVGAAHAQVEQAMRAAQAAGGPQAICIRPNAFLQGMLGRVGDEIQAGDAFSLALGDARVAFADIRDIAAVAAHVMVADAAPPVIEVTGPAARNGSDIAALLTRMLARPIRYQPMTVEDAMARVRASGMPEFTLRHQREVLTCLRQGAGSQVSSDFSDCLGRPASGVERYLEEVIQSCKHA